MAVPSQPGVLLTRRQIAVAVARLAGDITRDYRDKQPVLVAILKGSFVFLADLVRRLDFPLEIEFVRLSSYRGTETSGEIAMVQGLEIPVAGRPVLVVEDIVDTGLTTGFLLEYLRREKPASLKLCALLDKPARRRAPITIDYLGFTVPDKFLVGYGLDYNEQYRNLPDICVLEG